MVQGLSLYIVITSCTEEAKGNYVEPVAPQVCQQCRSRTKVQHFRSKVKHLLQVSTYHVWTVFGLLIPFLTSMQSSRSFSLAVRCLPRCCYSSTLAASYSTEKDLDQLLPVHRFGQEYVLKDGGDVMPSNRPSSHPSARTSKAGSTIHLEQTDIWQMNWD